MGSERDDVKGRKILVVLVVVLRSSRSPLVLSTSDLTANELSRYLLSLSAQVHLATATRWQAGKGGRERGSEGGRQQLLRLLRV